MSGYQPPSLDQALSAEDDPFANATVGLDDLPDDNVVPSAVADLETGHAPSAAAATAGLLQFTDSELGRQTVAGKIGQSVSVVPSVPDRGTAPAAEPVLPSSTSEETVMYSRFNVKHYRAYFDVDTSEVWSRMLDSLLCIPNPTFLEKHKDRPDLYGPFWISTTIVFLIAVVSNFIGWRNHGAAGESATTAWKYDADKVTYAGVLFYGYVGFIGFCVWATLRWFKSPISLSQIWCIYGYGMAIFLPVSIICAIPSVVASWLSVGLSTLLSGLFILLNLREAVFEHAGPKAVPLFVIMGCCHAALGVALKLYFFRYAKLKT